MKDKVQKIREEVERLMNDLIQEKEKGFDSDTDDACILELQNVLAYIDSLQEEPNILPVFDEGYWERLGEETVSEDLEEAIDSYLKSYWGGEKEKQDWPFLKKMVIYFANWQKTKNESTTEDFDEYINKLSKQFPEVSFAKLSRIAVRVAKWQKEQMMAKAIDAEVKVDAGGYPYIDKTIELYDYDKDEPLAKEGDKYKVVLIKED